MKDAVATMGGLLPDDAGGRDAVHVAVFSAHSAVPLFPSQRVAIVSSGEQDTEVSPLGECCGIVDPFLMTAVKPGERCWIYLYPRTITALSHRWSHPAFEVTAAVYVAPSRKLTSEKWIREYADRLNLAYVDLMDGAAEWLRDGEWLCQGGKLEGESTSDEFWSHYGIVTQTLVAPDKRENFFTCAC